MSKILEQLQETFDKAFSDYIKAHNPSASERDRKFQELENLYYDISFNLYEEEQ